MKNVLSLFLLVSFIAVLSVPAVSQVTVVNRVTEYSLGPAPTSVGLGNLWVGANVATGKYECLDHALQNCFATGGTPLPSDTGHANQVLSANGSGTFSWTTSYSYGYMRLGGCNLNGVVSGTAASQWGLYNFNCTAFGGQINNVDVEPSAGMNKDDGTEFYFTYSEITPSTFVVGSTIQMAFTTSHAAQTGGSPPVTYYLEAKCNPAAAWGSANQVSWVGSASAVTETAIANIPTTGCSADQRVQYRVVHKQSIDNTANYSLLIYGPVRTRFVTTVR